ncbi:MAG: ABC transporter ATP-binding protein, partial [Butyrivibrio sp.]|nr:ABC transporter ATP-binding protein [Butyrivibrio sp.]
MAKKSNASIETNTGKQTYSSRELIGRFLPYIKKYRGLLYLDLFFASLTTLCDIVLPMIMRRLTNSALGNSEALTVAILLKLVVLYVLLRLVDAGANFFMQSQGHIMGVYIETDMRRDAFEHLQRLSATYYSNHKIGQIMGRITNDLFDVTEFAHHCPEEFFIAGFKIVVSFIILSGSSLPLTLMIFACLPVMFVVSVKINHWLRQTQKAQRVQVGELNAAIEESLLG